MLMWSRIVDVLRSKMSWNHAFQCIPFRQLTATANGAPTSHFKNHLPEIWVLLFFHHIVENQTLKNRTCSLPSSYSLNSLTRNPMINKHVLVLTLFLDFFQVDSSLYCMFSFTWIFTCTLSTFHFRTLFCSFPLFKVGFVFIFLQNLSIETLETIENHTSATRLSKSNEFIF